jgi:hypothetical protein
LTDLARKPAFPNAAPLTGGMDRTGITVRQYYKAAAMQGVLAGDTEQLLSSVQVTSIASTLADAMITEDEEHASGQ